MSVLWLGRPGTKFPTIHFEIGWWCSSRIKHLSPSRHLSLSAEGSRSLAFKIVFLVSVSTADADSYFVGGSTIAQNG